MQEYKNILVIRLGALGDIAQKTGVFSAIRHKWPNAFITLMTNRSFFKLMQQSGYFNAYIEDNRSWNPLDYIRIIRQIISKKFDLIIDLQMQARTKKRYYPLIRLFTTSPFRWANLAAGHLFIKQTNKRFPLLWGITDQRILPLSPEIPSLAFCKANPDVLAQLPEKYVLLIPGCSPAHPYKRWPATNYRDLALRLASLNISTVVLGTNDEQAEIETICNGNEKAVNFCNKSSLLDIPQIAANSLAIIGNDTGPQHIAELGSVPAITLFCYVTKQSAVQRDNVKNLIGKEISDISVDKVFETLQSLWHKA